LFGHRTMAETDVDSEAVAHALAEKSPEEVIPEIDGAFAFVWYDTIKERLFAIRNDERPLTITETKNNFIIASEAGMVKMLLDREKEAILSTQTIPTGMLYSFDLKGNAPVTTPIDLKPRSYNNYGGYTSYNRTISTQVNNVRNTPTNTTTQQVTTPADTKSTDVRDVGGADNAVALFPNPHNWFDKGDK